MSKLSVLSDILNSWNKADKEAQIEGVKRLGLPKNNTAQDRAKAMGFDVDNIDYHVTDLDGKLGIEADGFKNFQKEKNFTLLDNPKLGKRDRYDTDIRSYYNKGNYTSDKPFSSEMTAQVDALEPKYTFPLVINKSKHFDYKNPDHVKDLLTPRPDKSTWSDMYPDEFGTGEVNPLDLVRIQKGQHNVMEDFMTQMNLKKRGYTGTNMKEPSNFDFSDATTTVTFQPELFRSPLAHFNPKYLGIGAGSVLSADLMANENNKDNMSNSFFDDISKRAEARRNLSWAKQQSLLDSGISTPSLSNGSTDNSLTAEQAQAKTKLQDQKSRQAYSELMALPVGAVEGMVGFGGDIERLGRGAYGAITADNGNRWDSFLNELGNSDTTLWNTENVQNWTNRQLEGTDFGNRLLEGKGGRLVGEILAPLPPVAGAVKYGGKALNVLDDGVTVANRYLNKFDIQPGLSIKAVDDIPVGAVDDATMAKSLGDRVIRTAENSEHIKPPRFGIDGKPLVQEVQPVMPRNTPLAENVGGYGARYGEGGVDANLVNAEDFYRSPLSKDVGRVDLSPNGTSQILPEQFGPQPLNRQTITTGAPTKGPEGTKFFDDISQPTNQGTLVRKADGTVVSTGELSNDVMRNIDDATAKQLDTIEEPPMSNWYDEQNPTRLDAKGREIESSYKKNIADYNKTSDLNDTNFTGDPSYKLKPKSPSAHEKVIESIANNRQELPDVLADNLLRKASDITADTTIDATTKEKLLGRLYEVYDDVTGVNITDGVATNKRYGTNVMERPRNQMGGRRVQEVGGLTDEQMAKPLDTKNTFKQVEDLDDIEYQADLYDNGITDKIDEFGEPVLDSNGVQVRVDADGNDIINSPSRLVSEAPTKDNLYKDLSAEEIGDADNFKERVHNSQRLANITDEPTVATNRQVLPTDGVGRTYKRTEVPDRIIPSLYDELGEVQVRGKTVGKSSMDADFQRATNKQTLNSNPLLVEELQLVEELEALQLQGKGKFTPEYMELAERINEFLRKQGVHPTQTNKYFGE